MYQPRPVVTKLAAFVLLVVDAFEMKLVTIVRQSLVRAIKEFTGPIATLKHHTFLLHTKFGSSIVSRRKLTNVAIFDFRGDISEKGAVDCD